LDWLVDTAAEIWGTTIVHMTLLSTNGTEGLSEFIFTFIYVLSFNL
jgi:hypothetical protein